MDLLRPLCAALLSAVILLPVRAAALPPTPEIARLACTVDVGNAAVACTPSGAASASLTASLSRNDAADPVWAVEVAVHNTSGGFLSAAPDSAPDAEGIGLHLSQAPAATAGVGNVSAVGPDALWLDAVLAPGEHSAPGTFRFRLPATVEAFTFSISVRATITFPRGTVSASRASVVASETRALAVAVRAPSGTLLPPAAATFSSDDEAVATVDGTGTLTGVGPGSTTVTVRSGAAAALVDVDVCPNLAVGGVYHASLSDGGRVCVGGYSGAEYTVLPTNQSTASSLTIALTGTGIGGVTGPPSPIVPSGADRAVLLSIDGAPVEGGALPNDTGHIDILERDRAELTPLLAAGTARLVVDNKAARTGDPARTIPPGVPTVGDSWQLNVAAGCTGTLDIHTGTVRAVSNHAIIVSDDGNPSGGFTAAQYDALAVSFDQVAWPAITAAFGAPTDLDGNGRIVLFYTRAVNELSPPASSAVTTGYVTSRDLFSSATGGCTRSNEGEIAYMLVPDPTGEVNGNVRTVSSVEGSTIGTAGHELQHLINASRRIYVNGAPGFEDVWLNEGLSHVGEELMFYGQSEGLAPRQNVNLSMLTTGPFASRRVAAFNAYANHNYGRLRTFLQNPHRWHPYSATDELGNRGAIWAFLRYAADRRNGTDNDLWAALANSTTAGLPNLRQSLGLASEAELLTWFRDWNVALYADDAVSGIAATYQTTSWNFRSVFGGLGGFPLSTRPLSDGVAMSQTYAQGGSTAFARAGVPASGVATLRVSAPGAPGPIPVSVLRTK